MAELDLVGVSYLSTEYDHKHLKEWKLRRERRNG
jgi:hypothetical protein